MDSQFLLEIYNKQAKMIYFYLKKNGCNHEDAEDIVQESYMKYIAYSSGVSSEKALSYIFTIAMNEFKKKLKKKGREQEISIDDHQFWSNFANDEDTASSVLSIEMNQEISIVLKEMKEIYSQLLVLKYELELSYNEISLLLGMKKEKHEEYRIIFRREQCSPIDLPSRRSLRIEVPFSNSDNLLLWQKNQGTKKLVMPQKQKIEMNIESRLRR